MKTFVILFLTTSLFIACGKNNKTGNGTYSYSSNPGPQKIIADDIDGDFLTSKNDPNPYIADYVSIISGYTTGYGARLFQQTSALPSQCRNQKRAVIPLPWT